MASRRRLGVLLGESGVGKSLVLQAAARQLARQGLDVVSVDAWGSARVELLGKSRPDLATGPSDDFDPTQLWRQIADRVAENRLQQVGTVLLVDEAGQAGPDAVTQILRLTRLDASPAARWTIVLAAEPAQAARWSWTSANWSTCASICGPG